MTFVIIIVLSGQRYIRAAVMTAAGCMGREIPFDGENGATFEIILRRFCGFRPLISIVFDLAMSDKAESKKVRNPATLGFQGPVIVVDG